jgi:pyruvate/2-oxoglutarate dehydrogenase complex dihydrolipoamide acyltransferase (E2) component
MALWAPTMFKLGDLRIPTMAPSVRLRRTNQDASAASKPSRTHQPALSVDWLTAGAFVLTVGSLAGAALDSYTSLCVVGGDLAHIGRASSCVDVGGWDTRTFPLAVDMGWGGALLTTVRLARTVGIDNWRWSVVLAFELLVAAVTVAGNAFHGMVLDGAVLSAGQRLLVALVASSVPGVVAVGSGFSLSVLISTRHGVPEPQRRPRPQRSEPDAPPIDAPPAGVQRAIDKPERPSDRRLLEVMRAIARERGIDVADVPARAVAERCGFPSDHSTMRTWLRAVKADIRQGAAQVA